MLGGKLGMYFLGYIGEYNTVQSILEYINNHIPSSNSILLGTGEYNGVKMFFKIYVYWKSVSSNVPQYCFGYMLTYGNNAYKIGTQEYIVYEKTF